MARLTRGLLLVALTIPLSAALPFAAPSSAFACTCVYFPEGQPDVSSAVAAAAEAEDGAVFVGTPTDERSDDSTTFYEFDVREVFRGSVGARTTVSTPNETTLCGSVLLLDHEYLVFSDEFAVADAPLKVNKCSPTTLSTNAESRAETIAQYGEPRVITDAEMAEAGRADRSTSTAVAIGVGIGLIAIAIAVAWRLYRRAHPL